MEAAGKLYREQYGLEVVILRFSNIYGPGSLERTSVIANWCKQALTNKEIIIYGSGEQTRDFVYIDDVVNALWDYSHISSPSKEIAAISDEQTSLIKIAEYIAGQTGACISYRESREGDVMANNFPKGERISISHQNLYDNIDKTLEYFRNELD